MKRILLLFTAIFSLYLNAQSEGVPSASIGGVVLYNPATNNNSPFVEKGKQLVLKFDELNASYKRYQYTFEYCNHDWTPSRAFQSDYLQGFKQDFVRDYKNAFGTQQSYTHYSITFPNSNINLKLSGNYIIKVFERDPRKPILTKRFSIYENNVGVETQLAHGKDLETQHQINLNIHYDSKVTNLTQNIQNVWGAVLKNFNWNEAITELRPTYTSTNKLTFNTIDNVFAAGNEYRWLDTKLRNIKGLTTANIIQDETTGIYHHYLNIDQGRAFQGYWNDEDYQGGYYIRTVDRINEENIDTEADYIMVHFTYQPQKEFVDKDMYIIGAFNDWKLSPQNKMVYNAAENRYGCALLLKQGTYNYQYQLTQKGTYTPAKENVEGNYWQTTNRYTGLLYYRPWGQDYDLLIGIGEIGK